MSYIFPLYSANATQAETLTTATKEIEVNGRLIEFTVAASTAAVATLASVPVGVVFTLKGTSISATGSASATITTKANKTIVLTNAQIVTLMSVENDEFVIMDAVGAEGIAATATGTIIPA